MYDPFNVCMFPINMFPLFMYEKERTYCLYQCSSLGGQRQSEPKQIDFFFEQSFK